MESFAKQGIRDVWKYGIAFRGKTVWIERIRLGNHEGRKASINAGEDTGGCP